MNVNVFDLFTFRGNSDIYLNYICVCCFIFFHFSSFQLAGFAGFDGEFDA